MLCIFIFIYIYHNICIHSFVGDWTLVFSHCDYFKNYYNEKGMYKSFQIIIIIEFLVWMPQHKIAVDPLSRTL